MAEPLLSAEVYFRDGDRRRTSGTVRLTGALTPRRECTVLWYLPIEQYDAVMAELFGTGRRFRLTLTPIEEG